EERIEMSQHKPTPPPLVQRRSSGGVLRTNGEVVLEVGASTGLPHEVLSRRCSGQLGARAGCYPKRSSRCQQPRLIAVNMAGRRYTAKWVPFRPRWGIGYSCKNDISRERDCRHVPLGSSRTRK